MKIFYSISTHWDREWYKPFQNFRYHLVEMTDELLDTLEKGDIETFTFDGQTIVLDDYLDIRSENFDRLRKLIQEGRIKVGPWYVMPDELLVSGESLVENLLVGHNTADKYNAKSWKFGYINDIFGHVAQFPQILNGFGIHGAYLGRGAGNDRQFVWKAPDGSECFVFNYSYSKIKKGFDESDDKKKFLSDYIDEHKIPVAVINYTDDHAVIDSNTVEFKKLIDSMPYDISEGMENYADEVAKYYDKLPKIEGELIATARTQDDFRAVTDSISSYYTLKQENDICEVLAYNTLAPMIVMGESYGISGKRAYFDIARKYLLKNQPHDSICGCSVDDVHRNMFYRYNQVKEITDVVLEDLTTKLLADSVSDEYYLYVYNFGITTREGVITVDVDFPRDWESKMLTNTLERPEYMFKIVDENENDVEYQILHAELCSERYDRQTVIPTFKHTIAMKTTLKPFGITKFKVVPSDSLNREPQYNHMGILKAENKYLELNITPTGLISITNKATGKVYDGINTFVEDGDAGNGWFYEPSGYDAQTVVSLGGTVEVINKGSLLNRFRITSYMNVPSNGNRNELSRGENYTRMKIVTTVTLRADDKKVEFETEIDNTAKDHRVRVIFPTAIDGDSYITSQAFCFNERKRGVTSVGINSREPESYEKNTAGIVGVSDDTDSLFFIGKEGLHQAGVYPDGTISVVLFRAFGHAFHQPKIVDGQLNETLKFTYALSISDDGLWNEQRTVDDRPYTVFCKEDSKNIESLISIDNKNVVLSVIKPAEHKNGWIVRLFNPTKDTINTKLRVNMDLKEIYETTLEEEVVKTMDCTNSCVDISFEPYRIKTFYFDSDAYRHNESEKTK